MDWEPSSYTYADLRRDHTKRLEQEQKSLQQIRNHTSALQLFMRFLGRGDVDCFSMDFSKDFKTNLAGFYNWSKEQGISIATIANRISCIRQIRKTSIIFSYGTKESFCGLLRTSMEIKGFSCLGLAKQTGMTRSTISAWLNGVVPMRKSAGHIIRIEKALGLEKSLLLSKAEKFWNRLEYNNTFPEIESRIRGSQLQQDKYYYKGENDRIRSEWRELVKFYTSPYLVDSLERNSTWRVKEYSRIVHPTHWSGEAPNGYCSTASFRWGTFSSFFGFLVRDTDKGGKGMDESSLTIALVSRTDLVVDFIEFRRKRTGVYTQETRGCLTFFMTLLRKKTGFLWQQPTFGRFLPEPILLSQWHDWCEKSHATLRKIKENLKSGGHIKKGRNPQEPIQLIIATQRPIQIILNMISKMESEPVFDSSLVTSAIHYRDILLIKMMLSNPLRVNHFSIMTHANDNTGNLYKNENGQWRLRFLPDDFKNQKGAACGPYDVALSPWLYHDIERYFERYRSHLYGADTSNCVFLPGKRPGTKRISCINLTPMVISQRVFDITKRYIPGCPGFGAHAFRHIVATDYIKNNPNGFQVAASILHDRLETVMKEYAHIKVADGFSHWTNYFDAQVEASKGVKHE